MGSSCCKRNSFHAALLAPTSDRNGTNNRTESPHNVACWLRTQKRHTNLEYHAKRCHGSRDDIQYCKTINKSITNSARAGPLALKNCIRELVIGRRPLNGINIATIFHSSVKVGNVLSADILDYMADALQTEDLSAQGLGNLCYGLHRLKDSPAVKRLLKVLAQKCEQCTEDMTPQQIGNALYGLQGLSNSDELHHLLHSIRPKVKSCKGCSAQAVGNACWGLQSLSASAEVRSIVACLAEKVEQLIDMARTKDAINPLAVSGNLQTSLARNVVHGEFIMYGQSIGNALYGVGSLGECPEVLHLVAAIAVHVEIVEAPLKAMEVSNAMYGLRKLSDSPEIRRLLAALSIQLKVCSGHFTARHIASCLYGTRWIGDSKEMRCLLSALVVKVRECTDFDSQAYSNSLYGLQKMPYSKEVGALLRALASQMEKVSAPLRAWEIANALYGLKSLGDCPEVRLILADLTLKVKLCEKFDAQAISNALYGIHALTATPEAKHLLTELAAKIELYKGPFEPFALVNAFFGLRSMPDSNHARCILRALRQKLDQCREDFKGHMLANMIHSLRSLGDSPEVRDILSVLASKFEACGDQLKGYYISAACQGLHNLADSEEVRHVLKALTAKVRICHNFKAQYICICLQSLSSLLSSEDPSGDIAQLLQAFASKILECDDRSETVYIQRAIQCLREVEDRIGYPSFLAVMQKHTDIRSRPWPKLKACI